MENIQINGQRIWGPPKDWVGQAPSYGTEIFIKNIPDDVFEDELYHLFSQIGQVYEVRLPVHWTGVNKGYAFVRFTKISEADIAIERLNLYTIRQGRHIKVERSMDNTRLFLSSVPIEKTGEEIKADLLTVVENVKTVYVYPALKNPSMFRGYAFVEFICHRDAAIAKRILTPDVLFMLFEKKCVAAWANPLPFLNKETLKNINILFMRYIPNHIKTVTLRMAIETLILPDTMTKMKRVNDYAFLTFKNHEMADRALTKMKCNPFFLGLNAVQVEWAIPRELAKSFLSRSQPSEQEHDSEPNFDLKPESNYSQFKITDDCRNDYSDILITDYIKTNGMGNEDTPFESPTRKTQLRILQRQNTELKSSLSAKKPETDFKSSKINANVFNNSQKDNVKRPSALPDFGPMNPFAQQGIASPSACNEEESFITEFQNPDSECRSRAMHLKSWLKSLSSSSQFTYCPTSPLTSPSTGSSTNMSYKWDENCSQFSTGSGMSMGYDVHGMNMMGTSKRGHQFAMY